VRCQFLSYKLCASVETHLRLGTCIPRSPLDIRSLLPALLKRVTAGGYAPSCPVPLTHALYVYNVYLALKVHTFHCTSVISVISWVFRQQFLRFVFLAVRIYQTRKTGRSRLRIRCKSVIVLRPWYGFHSIDSTPRKAALAGQFFIHR